MPALPQYRTAFVPVVVALLALALTLALAGCAGGAGDDGGGIAGNSGAGGDWPAKARQGEIAFNARCAVCHGANAVGTTLGPPLAHRIYEPGHHQDFAIRSAIRNGVAAHHWQFGDMPPVPGVSDADVAAIICYVRAVQRDAGIIADGSLIPC